ncbi:MAG: vWA domain-containing protein [Polyangiaceae bacterium]
MSLRLSQLVSVPVLTAGLLGFAIWTGCSADPDDDTTSSSFQPSTSASSSGAGGEGASGGAAGTGGASISVGVGGGSGVGGADVCDETESLATQKQLDVIVLQDRSGSMSGPRWDGSVNALKSFANDPASAGINLGIVYFPAVNGTDECNVPDYKDVIAFGTLPQNAPAFVQSLDATEPGGGTPMSAGLEGALYAATAMQDQNPEHKVIVVLASDGEPGSCITDVATIASLAESAYNYNGVQTYGIFIAGNKATLDAITMAGGTGPAFDVSANIQAFADKMAGIRADAIGCEVTIPDPPQGEEFDKDLVNVKYTAGGQGAPSTLPKKTSKADCGAGAGWYYDNEQKPTEIIFCPASCQTVQADVEAKINVAFGCLSETN